MSSDTKSDADEHQTSAADDPTAMWDDEALREMGLNEVADLRSSRASDEGEGKRARLKKKLQLSRRRRAEMVSWVVTIVLALSLGAGVFLLVRHLRGG